MVKSPIYQVMCLLCGQFYIGESYRWARDRLLEHLQYATNPNSKSYKNEALAEHYRKLHVNLKPKIEFKILTTYQSTVRRKILEAFYINKLKPSINNRDECIVLERFILY